MKKGFKIALLVILLGFLFIPMVQKRVKVFDEGRPLDGYFEPAQDTVLTGENWFSRAYQRKKENVINERFGLRAFLVRLNNQINFSLFDDTRVQNMIKGKENYLFASNFLDTYSGRNFVGRKAHADSVFNSILQLNKFLLERNKKLIVCIAPCKESFYPEFLPDTCKEHLKEENYYSYYNKKFTGSEIPYIDYQSYFQKLKPTTKYPLFAQGAFHWTTYGACLALDSLIKVVRHEMGKKVNLIKLTSVELTDTARFTDDDEGRAMNLLEKVNDKKLAYPKIEYVFSQDSCYRPKVLIVGDSFFYGLNNTWVPLTVFSKDSYFLYYYRQAVTYNNEKKDQDVSTMDMKKELEDTDLVILFFTIGNLNDFPYNATKMME